jgi:hypothetical protein
VQRVVLHYRPLNQAQDWKQLPMRKGTGDEFRVTVPGQEIAPRWDFQYYFEVLTEGGGGRLWPSWEQGPPYVVVKVDRATK